MPGKKTGTPRKKRSRKTSSHKPRRNKRPGADSAMPLPLRDRRALEKTSFDLGRVLRQHEFGSIDEANEFLQQFIGAGGGQFPTEPSTPLEQAQEKMYEAWDAAGRRRAKLAREALEICPDCADAYVLLAEETARTPEEALKLYQEGVRAGERALGPKPFADDVGHFWGILDTRPYMRALAGAAECLVAIGEVAQATTHYRELLRLNPGDNQGNRYMLAQLLLKQELDDEVERLLNSYHEDSAAWLYTRALLEYRRRGPGKVATKALIKAFDQNRFVPLYLTAMKKPPRQLPGFMGIGDENEAIHYFVDSVEGWLDTPGALPWFVSVLADAVGESAESRPS